MPLSKAIQLLDDLIKEVEQMPTTRAAGGEAKGGGDAAWGPAVPPGHTAFSWGLAPGLNADTPAQVEKKKHQRNTRRKSSTSQGQRTRRKSSNSQGKQQQQKQTQQKGQQQKQQKGKQQKQQKGKQQKNQKKGQQKGPEVPLFYRLDIRVGKIIKAWKHDNANSMFVEHIDIGEDKPRQVCSGLWGKIPQEQFEGSRCLVVVNLKPANLRKIMSYGMVLCAANADKSLIELVQPPADTPLGARVYLEGDPDAKLEDWPAELNVNGKNKNSAWAKAAPNFAINAEGTFHFDGKVVRTLDGPVTSPTLKSVKVS